MKTKNGWLKTVVLLLCILVLTGVDQITKWLAAEHLSGISGIQIIPGVFELTYVENTGAAFGLFEGKQIGLILFSAAAFILLFCGYLHYSEQGKLTVFSSLCFVLLMAGCLGNLTDRILRGYVVDFFYFRAIDFPVFNVADCYVTVSAIGICLLALTDGKEEDDPGANTGA